MRPSVWMLVVLAAAATSCASRRPVLYPNEQLKRVGHAAAERDIDECMARAKEVGSPGSGAARDVATETTVGAGAGAAIGAVGGAVVGEAGEGAAVGAATGGTAGFLSSLFRVFQTREPAPVYANYVDRCLRERGYEPIGWK